MLGFEYRWLMLNPIVRGVVLSLGVAAFCASCLFLNHSAEAIALESAGVVNAAHPAAEVQAVWPRAAVRLWFLIPQLLPSGPR